MYKPTQVRKVSAAPTAVTGMTLHLTSTMNSQVSLSWSYQEVCTYVAAVAATPL